MTNQNYSAKEVEKILKIYSELRNVIRNYENLGNDYGYERFRGRRIAIRHFQNVGASEDVKRKVVGDIERHEEDVFSGRRRRELEKKLGELTKKAEEYILFTSIRETIELVQGEVFKGLGKFYSNMFEKPEQIETYKKLLRKDDLFNLVQSHNKP